MSPELIGAIVALLTSVAGYIKIASDRRKTSVSRDNTEEQLSTRVSTLEVKMDTLLELKDDVKEMRRSFDKLLGYLQIKFNNEFRE